jgi:hypothetical protein
MPDDPPRAARRTADVVLRGVARTARARVHWPAPDVGAPVAPLVVLFADDDHLVSELVTGLHVVVLTVSATHAAEAHAALCWAADHAGQLGADAARIALVGDQAGAALAERVATLAGEEGWPPLRHVALLWPQHDPGSGLDGLARALVPHPEPTRRAR